MFPPSTSGHRVWPSGEITSSAPGMDGECDFRLTRPLVGVIPFVSLGVTTTCGSTTPRKTRHGSTGSRSGPAPPPARPDDRRRIGTGIGARNSWRSGTSTASGPPGVPPSAHPPALTGSHSETGTEQGRGARVRTAPASTSGRRPRLPLREPRTRTRVAGANRVSSGNRRRGATADKCARTRRSGRAPDHHE